MGRHANGIGRDQQTLLQYAGEKNSTFRAALAGLIISLLATLVLYALMSFSFNQGWQVQVREASEMLRLALAGIVLDLFLALFSLSLMWSRMEAEVLTKTKEVLAQQGSNYADDLLTPYREQIVGVWAIHTSFPFWNPAMQKVLPFTRETNCVVGINTKHKLTFQFSIQNSQIFEHHDVAVDLISINVDRKPYQLVYFSQHKVKIKGPLADQLRLSRAESELTQKTFVYLEYEPESDGKVRRLKGTWYDLDVATTGILNKLQSLMAGGTAASGLPPVPNTGRVEFEKKESSASSSGP